MFQEFAILAAAIAFELIEVDEAQRRRIDAIIVTVPHRPH